MAGEGRLQDADVAHQQTGAVPKPGAAWTEARGVRAKISHALVMTTTNKDVSVTRLRSDRKLTLTH